MDRLKRPPLHCRGRSIKKHKCHPRWIYPPVDPSVRSPALNYDIMGLQVDKLTIIQLEIDLPGEDDS